MTSLLLQQLVLAICFVESGNDPLALNYQDGKGHNNHSFGMCQVTYETAKELGLPQQESCHNDLRPRFKRTPKSCKLFDPSVNLQYAEMYLKKKLKKYDNDIKRAVSAYNAGTATLSNSSYVRKVLKRLKYEQQRGIYELTSTQKETP